MPFRFLIDYRPFPLIRIWLWCWKIIIWGSSFQIDIAPFRDPDEPMRQLFPGFQERSVAFHQEGLQSLVWVSSFPSYMAG